MRYGDCPICGKGILYLKAEACSPKCDNKRLLLLQDEAPFEPPPKPESKPTPEPEPEPLGNEDPFPWLDREIL